MQPKNPPLTITALLTLLLVSALLECAENEDPFGLQDYWVSR